MSAKRIKKVHVCAEKESSLHTLDPPDTTHTRDGMCETRAEVVFSRAEPSRASNQSEKAMSAPREV